MVALPASPRPTCGRFACLLAVLLMAATLLFAADSTPAQLSPEARNAFKLGRDALSNQNWDEAIRNLEMVVNAYKADIDAWYLLGLAYEGKGETEKAQTAFQEAIKLDRRFATPYLHLAGLELTRGSTARARQWLNDCLALDQGNPQALYALGVVAYQEGKKDDAVGYWTQSLRKAPKFAPTSFNLGVVSYEQGQYPKAAQYFAQAAQLDAKQPRYPYAMAMVFFRVNAPEQALKTLELMIKEYPQTAYAELATGIIALQNRNLKAADESFARARALAPAASAPLYWQGRSAIVGGDWNQAAIQLKQARSIDSADPDINEALQAAFMALQAWLRHDSRTAFNATVPPRLEPFAATDSGDKAAINPMPLVQERPGGFGAPIIPRLPEAESGEPSP